MPGLSGAAMDELDESVGIVARALEYILAHLQGSTATLFLSYLEVYNEQVHDLLLVESATTRPVAFSPRDPPTNRCSRVGLAVKHATSDGHVSVDHLTQVSVSSVAEASRLIARGNQQRMFRATAHNERSSRSHSVLQLRIERPIAEPARSEPRAARTQQAPTARHDLEALAGRPRWIGAVPAAATPERGAIASRR